MDGQPTSPAELPIAHQAGRGEGRTYAWSAFILVTALYILALALTVLGAGYASDFSTWGSAGWIGVFLVPLTTYAFPAVGALITLRRPRNIVGWLCLVIGMAWAASGVLEAYIHYALVTHGGSLPGLEVGFAFANVGWIPGIGLTIFLILLFPDGRLPSRRWRIVGVLAALTLLIITIVGLFGTENFADYGYPQIANPLRIDPIGPLLAQLQLVTLLLPVWVLAAAASIAVRYRRATGVERLQLKWLVAAGAAVALAFVLAVLASAAQEADSTEGTSLAAELAQNVSLASFALLPIAIGIATLRHRLYDIDFIVNRTLVYGGSTVVLAAAFGVANVASQRVLETASGQRSDLVTGALAVGPPRPRRSSRRTRTRRLSVCGGANTSATASRTH